MNSPPIQYKTGGRFIPIICFSKSIHSLLVDHYNLFIHNTMNSLSISLSFDRGTKPPATPNKTLGQPFFLLAMGSAYEFSVEKKNDLKSPLAILFLIHPPLSMVVFVSATRSLKSIIIPPSVRHTREWFN